MESGASPPPAESRGRNTREAIPARRGRLRKDKKMSFTTYYSRLVSKVKQGGPTAQEARRDYQAMLAQHMRSL